MNEKPIKPAFEDNKNPPFLHLAEEHSLNYSVFSKSSDIIMSASMASVKKFSDISNTKINKNLLHVFFDLLLCLSVNNFSNKNKDIFSAIIDGLHFKYYGQPSQNKISSSIQLMAIPETCFMLSMFNLDSDSFISMVATFISYANTNSIPGATQNLETAKIVFNLTNKIMPILNTKLEEVKKIKDGNN